MLFLFVDFIQNIIELAKRNNKEYIVYLSKSTLIIIKGNDIFIKKHIGLSYFEESNIRNFLVCNYGNRDLYIDNRETDFIRNKKLYYFYYTFINNQRNGDCKRDNLIIGKNKVRLIGDKTLFFNGDYLQSAIKNYISSICMGHTPLYLFGHGIIENNPNIYLNIYKTVQYLTKNNNEKKSPYFVISYEDDFIITCFNLNPKPKNPNPKNIFNLKLRRVVNRIKRYFSSIIELDTFTILHYLKSLDGLYEQKSKFFLFINMSVNISFFRYVFNPGMDLKINQSIINGLIDNRVIIIDSFFNANTTKDILKIIFSNSIDNKIENYMVMMWDVEMFGLVITCPAKSEFYGVNFKDCKTIWSYISSFSDDDKLKYFPVNILVFISIVLRKHDRNDMIDQVNKITTKFKILSKKYDRYPINNITMANFINISNKETICVFEEIIKQRLLFYPIYNTFKMHMNGKLINEESLFYYKHFTSTDQEYKITAEDYEYLIREIKLHFSVNNV